MSADDAEGDSLVVQWLIDTRNIWLVNEKAPRKDQMKEFEQVAGEALKALTAEEQAQVLRYFRVNDAKLSLASQLVKHFAITRLCSVPWAATIISKDEHKKPYYHPQAPGMKTLAFNVSHQAGIVPLIASTGIGEDVGTDAVCVNERQVHDYQLIEKGGFFSWVDVFAEVFAPSEVNSQKLSPDNLNLPLDVEALGYVRDAISRCQYRNQKVVWKDSTGTDHELDSNTIIDAKIRRWYAYWCLKEAYVKLTGEALLANWLRDLEFSNVRAPNAADADGLEQGEIVSDIGIYLKGMKVLGVHMELVALGKHHMIASAMRIGTREKVKFPRFKVLDIEDVLDTAQTS